MRKVEELGKPFQKQGFLKGTAMWKWRNIVIGSAVCVSCIFYGYRLVHGERIKLKKLEKPIEGTDPIAAKLRELELRKDKLSEGLHKPLPSTKDTPDA